jgi:hypothetical protein
MVREWAGWIAGTRLNQLFQEVSWVVPLSQSTHIVCVAIVFASASMLSLRLLGVGNSGRSVSQLVRTLVPWMYGALVVLLLTGAVQTIAEPMRQFVTPQFWWKMLMVVCVLLLTLWLARAVAREPARWDAVPTRPRGAQLFAVVFLALWIAIVVCGRLIGYTWPYYTSIVQSHGVPG